MKKNTKNNNIDIDDVEKLLIKDLENKKERKNKSIEINKFSNQKTLNIDDFSKEIVDYNKSFPEDNPILFHFERKLLKENIDLISAFNNNKSSQFKHHMKFYNQKIGEYDYTFFDESNSKKINNLIKNDTGN